MDPRSFSAPTSPATRRHPSTARCLGPSLPALVVWRWADRWELTGFGSAPFDTTVIATSVPGHASGAAFGAVGSRECGGTEGQAGDGVARPTVTCGGANTVCEEGLESAGRGP